MKFYIPFCFYKYVVINKSVIEMKQSEALKLKEGIEFICVMGGNGLSGNGFSGNGLSGNGLSGNGNSFSMDFNLSEDEFEKLTKELI